MRNKLKIFISLFFSTDYILFNLSAEEFTFESTSIEINEKNILFAKDGVHVNSNDGLEIYSNEATYYKKKNYLF